MKTKEVIGLLDDEKLTHNDLLIIFMVEKFGDEFYDLFGYPKRTALNEEFQKVLNKMKYKE
jgi:hypothetical protein